MSLALLKPLSAVAVAAAIASTTLLAPQAIDKLDPAGAYRSLAKAGFIPTAEPQDGGQFFTAPVRNAQTGEAMSVRIYRDGRVVTDRPMPAPSAERPAKATRYAAIAPAVQ